MSNEPIVQAVMAPVRESDIREACKPGHDELVDVFLTYKGAPLLDDDGNEKKHANGRAKVVTQEYFATLNGIHPNTLHRWLRGRGETRKQKFHQSGKLPGGQVGEFEFGGGDIDGWWR